MHSRTTHSRLLITVAQLITLVVSAALFGKSNTLAQEGSKGTDPSGAYSISATTVTAARPGDKLDSKPESAPASGGPRRNGKRRDSSAIQRQATNKATAVNPSSLQYLYTVEKNFPKGPPPAGQEHVRIGVTIWLLSPSQCPVRNCPLPAGKSKGLIDTAERIEDNAILTTGERVRLGLESLSGGGFVYVIDREQFADGTLGEAFLLFPSRNINAGKNWAQPGLQIQLPRAEGCFCVMSRNPQKVLVADNLIVIVSSTQLLGLSEIGENEIPLPVKLAKYVSRAGQAINYRGSLQGGRGLTQTPQELRAGAKGLIDTGPILTQNDLPPQNFYQNAVPRGTPAVFSFSLRYSTFGTMTQ
jgi:hypothetical protein